jgi:hypothetical protein
VLAFIRKLQYRKRICNEDLTAFYHHQTKLLLIMAQALTENTEAMVMINLDFFLHKFKKRRWRVNCKLFCVENEEIQNEKKI